MRRAFFAGAKVSTPADRGRYIEREKRREYKKVREKKEEEHTLKCAAS